MIRKSIINTFLTAGLSFAVTSCGSSIRNPEVLARMETDFLTDKQTTIIRHDPRNLFGAITVLSAIKDPELLKLINSNADRVQGSFGGVLVDKELMVYPLGFYSGKDGDTPDRACRTLSANPIEGQDDIALALVSDNHQPGVHTDIFAFMNPDGGVSVCFDPSKTQNAEVAILSTNIPG